MTDRKSILLAACLLALAGCAADTGYGAATGAVMDEGMEGMEGGGHHGHCEGPQRVLTVGDFDGDGTVGPSDVNTLSSWVEAGNYAAFFDRNLDGRLNGRDVSEVARSMGASSTAMDQELAITFWSTVRFMDRSQAIAEGYIAYTQAFGGHGEHWAMPYDGRFDHNIEFDRPEGLNYGVDGTLAAVFFYHGAHMSSADPAPEGYTGHHDMWHEHIGSCFGGVNPAAPSYDAASLDYTQCSTPAECFQRTGTTATIWNPRFHMLHAWLFRLNPCGTFAGTDPTLEGQEDETHVRESCTVEELLSI